MQNSECKIQNADTDSFVVTQVNSVRSSSRYLLAVCLHSAFFVLHYGATAQAWQLIERVLARVGTNAVTMTDVRAARELGLVETKPGENPEAVALERTIERQLMLDEVARFSPPEPADAAVAEEVAAMKLRAGSGLDALINATGLNDERLRQLARDTLRIRAYIAQRFGMSVQVTEDEARRYYEEHPAEFIRDGVQIAFEEAEPVARQRASAERLRSTIEKWVRDLRSRSGVVIVGGEGGSVPPSTSPR
ncbi:MAG TPA: hypothetical protein VFS23_24670 [Vicinamibacterales bacterium]|nr:hypothetical protein [Vicinamibacterales bacterium]